VQGKIFLLLSKFRSIKIAFAAISMSKKILSWTVWHISSAFCSGNRSLQPTTLVYIIDTIISYLLIISYDNNCH
jgi:hypothetical protein